MKLCDKLTATSNEQFLTELHQMLDNSNVHISWWGERLVTVNGYEESVTINQLASKFLRATALHRMNTSLPLQDRITYLGLWEKIQDLYAQSRLQLKLSCVYKILVPLLEFRPYCRACAGDPMACIEDWDDSGRKDDFFNFTPEEFAALWPSSEPARQGTCFPGGSYYGATREMVLGAASTIQTKEKSA